MAIIIEKRDINPVKYNLCNNYSGIYFIKIPR